MPENQPPTPPLTPAARPRLHHILLAIALLLFAYRAYDYYTPAFFGIADEHGYLMTAKRLALKASFAHVQKDPFAFVGETMMQSNAAEPAGPNAPMPAEIYYLRQPIGYPLLLAFFYRLQGESGPFLVNPLCGLALLAGVYILGRQLKNPLAGALAALLLAAHPVVLYYTIKPLSHVPDMAVGVWIIVAALTWKRDGKLWQALLIAAALAFAMFIRYTNILLALPLAVILWDARKTLRWPKIILHLAAALSLMVLAVLLLLAYHKLAFGNPFHTGYTAGGNERSFSLAYLAAHAPTMLQVLWEPATGLTLLWLPILAGAVILAIKDRTTLALLLLWAIPILLLNTAYYGKPEDNHLLYARFALSAYVPLLLLAFCWTHHLSALKNKFQLAAILILAASLLWIQADPVMNARGDKIIENPRLATWQHQGQLEMTRNMARLMYLYGHLATSKDKEGQPHAPPGSVILADNRTEYYLEYIDAYTIYSPSMYDRPSVERRIADLARVPTEFDPARTREIKNLLGSLNQESLNLKLREQLLKHARIGRPVFILSSDSANPAHSQILAWQTRLNLRLEPVNTLPPSSPDQPLTPALYQVLPHQNP